MDECNCVKQPTLGALEIIQGTTPTLTLNLTTDLSQGYDLRLAIKSGINTIFVLTNKDLTVTSSECGCTILAKFTQEQTFAMKKSISIMLRAKQITTNEVIGTKAIEVEIIRNYDDEVM